MKRIETGVDRLVRLVSQKKKISVDEAAKELGVSKIVVTEWAEFLTDEGLISLDYSLSRTYLKEKELSSADVEKKAKQYATKKETFVRRVDTSVQQLERQSKGFESIKKEFASLKSQIGKQVNDVREELMELRKYEEIKKNIDTDIEKETHKYKEQIKEASIALSHEQKKYESLLGEIQKESKHLAEEKGYVKTLHELEERFTKQQTILEGLLERARIEVKKGEHEVLQSEKHIDDLAKRASKLRDSLSDLKKNKIDTLDRRREEHEQEIERLRKNVAEKAKKMKQSIHDDISEGTKAASKFDAFFKRRVQTDKLISELDKEKDALEHELAGLRRSAVSFKIASRGDTDKHLKELEKKYASLEKRRSAYKKKLQKLVDLIVH